MDNYRFSVKFLEEANRFLESLDEKERIKIIYNIRKAQSCNDKELFKSFKTRFGNLEPCIIEHTLDFLHFGTKQKILKLLSFQLTE